MNLFAHDDERVYSHECNEVRRAAPLQRFNKRLAIADEESAREIATSIRVVSQVLRHPCANHVRLMGVISQHFSNRGPSKHAERDGSRNRIPWQPEEVRTAAAREH